MKQVILSMGVLLGILVGITGLIAQPTLYVKERTGTQTSFPLSGIRTLEFSGVTMTITITGGTTREYPLGDIRFLSFKNFFTGIGEPDPNAGHIAIRVYPNPVGNTLKVEYTGGQANGRTVEIVDLEGRVLLDARLQDSITEIDITNIKSGIYICRIQNGPKGVATKFIKN